MCLDIVLNSKEKKAVLAKLKDTVVVWKVLLKPYIDRYTHKRVNYYQTDCQNFPVFAGEVKFKQSCIANLYRGGGHFWLTKAGAEAWGVKSRERLVRCTVKKSDINTIGLQNNYSVVVVKKATFPKYIGKRKTQ